MLPNPNRNPPALAVGRFKCICDYWKIGMEHIIDYIRVTHREGRGGYKGRSFKFCPWCGTELVEDTVPKVVRMPVLESAKPEKKS